MEDILRLLFVAVLAILGSSVVGFVPLWAAWNWVGVDVFQFEPINLMQSFGVMLLVSCLLFPASGWFNVKL